MAALFKYTVFEPILTGGLLYALTRGSPELRERILRPLASLPLTIQPETLVKSLKWLFALGLVGRVNDFLNKWAMDNWQLFGRDGGAPWVWDQEVAVITGGSGGIGTEVVKTLASKGVKVAILDMVPPPVQVKSFKNVHYFECDITDPKAVHEAANSVKATLGTVTILINNAGIGRTFTILEVPNEFLEKIFHINLISMWYTVKEFLPGMIAAKKGHIVTIASMASYTAVAGMVDYCVTKAGAMSFSEGLNQELKYRYNAPFVKTTSVHPFWVQTALLVDWKDSLTRIGTPLMKPDFVASKITDAIFSGRSQQVNLPWHMAPAAGARGWPHWLKMRINDGTRFMATEKKKA